jgi:hypothetical protein
MLSPCGWPRSRGMAQSLHSTAAGVASCAPLAPLLRPGDHRWPGETMAGCQLQLYTRAVQHLCGQLYSTCVGSCTAPVWAAVQHLCTAPMWAAVQHLCGQLYSTCVGSCTAPVYSTCVGATAHTPCLEPRRVSKAQALDQLWTSSRPACHSVTTAHMAAKWGSSVRRRWSKCTAGQVVRGSLVSHASGPTAAAQVTIAGLEAAKTVWQSQKDGGGGGGGGGQHTETLNYAQVCLIVLLCIDSTTYV